MRAQYAPETINLKWLDSNGNTTTTNTCTYDGGLTLPAQPSTKPGYTFMGWEVVPQYDFTNLNVYTDGFMRYSIGVDNGSDVCWKSISENNSNTAHGNCSSDIYKDLQRDEFKVVFNYGMVYGMALCSNTSGTESVAGIPNESVSGGHCWCKLTGYIPDGGSEKYAPLNIVPWVYIDNMGVSTCVTYCANSCSNFLVSVRTFRIAAFGQSGS